MEDTSKQRKGFAVSGKASSAGRAGGKKGKGRKLSPEHIAKIRAARLRQEAERRTHKQTKGE